MIDLGPTTTLPVTRTLSSEDPCLANNSQVQAADPVNTYSGNFTHQETDISIPTRGLPLTFERSYNTLGISATTTITPLGKGWTHSYNMRLNFTRDSGNQITSATLIAPRGSHLTFTRTTTGTYTSGPGIRATLVQNGDGSFALTRGDQIVYTFDSGGRLAALQDGHGVTTTLSYTGNDLTTIAAADGRALNLTYTNGYLTRITDPLVRTVAFTYTGDTLIEVQDLRGQRWQYGYDSHGWLTTLTDPDGHSVTNTYDTSGRVITQTDRLNQPTTFAYRTGQTVVTVASSRVMTHTYNASGALTRITDTLGNATTYTYDDNFNLKSQTDARGNTTTYTWDASGCGVTAVAEPLERTTRMTYDNRHNLRTLTDPLAHTTYFSYDATLDRLRTITQTVTLTTTPRIFTTTLSYAADGQLAAVTDPNGGTTRYTYNAYGSPVVITDALTHPTYLAYDLAGRVIRVTDTRGYTTTFSYDAGDNPVRTTDALNQSTDYGYDRLGRLTVITNVTTGYTTTFGYDAASRLITVTNALNGRTRYSYDAFGQLTQVIDAQGSPTRFAYDGAGRLSSMTNVLSGTLRYGYDSVGNVTAITNTRTYSVTTLGYDALNRLTVLTDALGQPTHYAYDKAGNLVGSLDPTAVALRYGYDELNRLTVISGTTLAGDLGRLAAYTYDPVGNLLKFSDANTNATSYLYDALNRLTRVTDPNTVSTVYGYDWGGNLTSVKMANAANRITRYTYDPLNRLSSVTDPLTHTTAYGYDALGYTTVITDADSGVTRLGYDRLGRVTQVQYPGTTVSYAYDPVGNRTAMTDSTGTTRYEYNRLSQAVAITAPLMSVVRYTYDVEGNRTQVSSGGKVVTYTYDGLNRLARVTDWSGKTTSYSYDKAGRVTQVQQPNGVQTAYRYTAGRLTSMSTYNQSTAQMPWRVRYDYTLDAAGRRTKVVELHYLRVYLPLILRNSTTAGEGLLGGGDEEEGLLAPEPLESPLSAPLASPLETPEVPAEEEGAEAEMAGLAYHPVYLPLVLQGFPQQGEEVPAKEAAEGEGVLEQVAELLAGEGSGEVLATTFTSPLPCSYPAAIRNGEVISYTYDKVGQVRMAAYSSGRCYQYFYTRAYDRQVLTATTQFTLSARTVYTYNAASRLTKVNATSYTYDNRGNLLSDGVWSYSYDGAGRLVRATTVSQTQVYTYNGDGLRVAQGLNGVETRFTWDQAAELPQVLATSGGQYALYGLDRIGVQQGSTWYYPHTDALGSVRQWSNSAGAVVGNASYDPFGVPIVKEGTLPTGWGYAGEWTDPSGLQYLRARWYNPAIGRFTQVDPFAGVLSQPGTLNPYIYGLNNPVMYTDPSGKIVDPVTAIVVGAATGAVVNIFIQGVRTQSVDPAEVVGAAVAGGAMAYLMMLGPVPAVSTFWPLVRHGAFAGALAGQAGIFAETAACELLERRTLDLGRVWRYARKNGLFNLYTIIGDASAGAAGVAAGFGLRRAFQPLSCVPCLLNRPPMFFDGVAQASIPVMFWEVSQGYLEEGVQNAVDYGSGAMAYWFEAMAQQ